MSLVQRWLLLSGLSVETPVLLTREMTSISKRILYCLQRRRWLSNLEALYIVQKLVDDGPHVHTKLPPASVYNGRTCKMLY